VRDTTSKLRELEKILRENTGKSDLHGMQTVRDTVKTLWHDCSFEEILNDPRFYEHPVSSIPLLTEDENLESLKNKNVPQEIIDSLSLVEVGYRSFNDQIYTGQIIVHKELVDSTKNVFKRILKETNFPITSIIPLNLYNWNSSVRYNNSGGFDWRFVAGSDEITDHAFGAAIDINPLINPWVNGSSDNRSYDPSLRGTLFPGSHVVKIFKEAGWKWGGNWENSKDWQHFYRPEIPFKYYGKVEVKE
jgi:peptidoglycan LD-endopeptidase CwlK